MYKTFNWYAVCRTDLIDTVMFCKKILVGRSKSTNLFFDTIKYQMKKKYPILIRKKLSNDDNIKIGGKFLVEQDRHNKKSIIVEFFLPGSKHINISSEYLLNIAKCIADTVLHELIHMRQYRSSNYSINFYPSYFSTIEIQAYSFNIACELYDNILDKTKMFSLIEKNKIAEFSNTYNFYLQLCNNNMQHTAMRKLKNQIKKYVPLVEKGFPFRSGKWLS